MALQSLGLLFTNVFYNNKKRQVRQQLAKIEEEMFEDDKSFNEDDSLLL